MDKVTFIVDKNKTDGLDWMYPAYAPDLTDDQARTIAIHNLGKSIGRLAEAIERYCEKSG